MTEKELKKEKKVEEHEPVSTEAMVDNLIQQAVQAAAEPGGGKTVKINCVYPEHKDEWVEFTRDGWYFKDLREYEEAIGVSKLSDLVCRKIVSWNITDKGKVIPFRPGLLRNQLAKLPADQKDERKTTETKLEMSYRLGLDEVPPMMSAFVIASFRTAYNLVGALSPNV